MSVKNVTSISDLEAESYIDTRDLQELLDSLESDIQDDDEAKADASLAPSLRMEDWEREEKEALLALLRELRDHVYEWKDGTTLISEDDWKDYARQTAYELGMVERDSQMECYIDWNAWADACQMDYSSVEIGSTIFYYR